LFFKQYFPYPYDTIINTIYDSFKDNLEIEETPIVDFSDSLNSSDEFAPLVEFLRNCCVSFRDPSFLNSEELTARKYLEDRYIPEKVISKMFFCSSPVEYADVKFKDHIIIPFYNEFDIPYYFQARYVGPDKNARRYLTSDFDCCPKKALYNEKIVDTSDIIFIVEGILDSTNIHNAISIAGTGVSKDLIDYISTTFPKRIWLNDNDKAGKELTTSLLKQNQTCFVWPRTVKLKDINNLAVKMKKEYIPKGWLINNSFNGIAGLGKMI